MNFHYIIIISVLFFSNLIAEESAWRFRSEGTLEQIIINQQEVRRFNEKVRIEKDGVTLFTDRAEHFLKKNELSLTGNVQMIQNQDTVKCDELYYWTKNDSIEAIGNVQMIQKNITLKGEKMVIQYKDSLLKNVILNNNATMKRRKKLGISKNKKLKKQFIDEMKSNTMLAKFNNKKQISSLTLAGMAYSLFNVENDSLFIGINQTTGDSIIIYFDEKNISNINVLGGARGEFEPDEYNANVDTTIIYKAQEMQYFVKQEKTTLINNAEVLYQDIKLIANHIEVDWNINYLTAIQIDNNKPTVQSSNMKPITGDKLKFNLKTQHGVIQKGITSFNDGLYTGNNIYRDNPNVYHVSESNYTTCDHDPPHFHIGSKYMKILPGDKLIAKWLTLYIADFPVPIIPIPFAIFPNKGTNRQSGWIMPAFGSTKQSGTFFRKLGYYWAPNDYYDLKLTLDFYDQIGTTFKTYLNYNKRYKFNGSINFSYTKNLFQTNDITELFDSYDGGWNLVFKHISIFDPTQNLKINYEYLSKSTLFQNELGFELKNRLKQNIRSSAIYSKQWKKYNNSLSIHLSENYSINDFNMTPNNNNELLVFKTQELPNISFFHGLSPIFGRGTKWYNAFYWQISSQLKGKQTIAHFSKDGINWDNESDSIIFNDDVWYSNYNNHYSNYKSGISNKLNFSYKTKNIWGWLIVRPSINAKEDWIFSYKEHIINDNLIDSSITINRFKRRLTGSSNISFSTTAYGIFPVEIGRLAGLRHIITPNITFSYRPDFSNQIYNYFQYDEITGEKFDYFNNSIVGGTPQTKSQLISFNVRNLFQIKTKKEEQYEKMNILNWNVTSSYNFSADSLKWNLINSSFRTKIYGLNIDLNMKHNPYKKILIADNESNINKITTINQINYFPSIERIEASTNIKLTGKKKIYQKQNEENLIADFTDQNIQANNQAKPNISSSNLWETTFSLRYQLKPKVTILEENNMQTEYQDWENIFWINSNIKFNLTRGWKVNYSSRFDLENNQIIDHHFSIFRDLHCWEFSFKWWPNQNNKGGYMLYINVKNPDLKDIKLQSTSSNLFGL